MLEAYTTLGYLAAVTNNIHLGTAMTGATYRHPGLLIKIVTTLDILSRGRAWLGIGAAWHEYEHHALGVPFPSRNERFARLEETIKIALQMWMDDQSPFNGSYFTLDRPLNRPLPLRKPHPPIMIGGNGETKTLRLVAQYADACNLIMNCDIKHKLEVLQAHCQGIGRNYSEIERTTIGSYKITSDGAGVSVSPSQLIDLLSEQAKLGIQHALLDLRDPWDLTQIDCLGHNVVPSVARL
jgi:F420-dependent oxidoreductase-like protein